MRYLYPRLQHVAVCFRHLISTSSESVTVVKMWSSSGKGVLAVIVLMTISEVVAKPPKPIKDFHYIAPNDYSFVARLAFDGNGARSTCAGAIITPRHILTAGSCIYDKTGGTVYTSLQRDPNGNAVATGIDRLHVQNFTMRTSNREVQNDIGIVTLSNDLEFGLRQTNIGLPSSQPEYISAWFAGWEPTNDKGDVQLAFKKTDISLTSGQQCLNNGTDDFKAQKLCGRQPDSSCPGESGSPLISNGILYAIASVDPCSGGSERLYTSVFHHVNWIRSVVESQSSVS